MHSYDVAQAEPITETLVGRQKETDETFGSRMAALRAAAGYTQRSLAAELGISQRMVAYYESQSDRPPAHLLPALAEAFGISVDQLLGREPVSPRKRPVNAQLMRKLRQVEKLPPRARTAVLEHIDALVSKHGRSGSR
jgi:transcriptional regulator with XRE-family HTH domain